MKFFIGLTFLVFSNLTLFSQEANLPIVHQLKSEVITTVVSTDYHTIYGNKMSCGFTNMTIFIGPCDQNDTYSTNGTLSFVDPPLTGTLVVTDDCSGMDTTINAPFTSPLNWSISGIPTGFGNCNMTAVFSDDTTCWINVNFQMPQPCNCVAQIGTFTTSITPNTGQTPYQLCFGDQLTILANGDFVPPGSVGPPPLPPFTYSPGLAYLLYSCPPTIGVNPSNAFPNNSIGNDPCFIGFVSSGNSLMDVNVMGAPTWPGPWIDNTVYIVPITMYDTLNLLYSYVSAPQLPCYEMGAPIAVQYLPEITYNAVSNCLDSSVAITLNGGIPAMDSSMFTATNLMPANANFVNSTATDGGTITINGLFDGDSYSFDVMDTNGCAVTISGGPYAGLPNVILPPYNPDSICQYELPYLLTTGTPMGGVYSGVGVVGNVFNPILSPGPYTIYYTLTGSPGCANTDSSVMNLYICAGVAEYDQLKVSIYPNPVHDDLTIISDLELRSVQILDITGSIVMKLNRNLSVINVSHLSKGVYFLRLESEKGVVTKKFMKQ